jgi:hypothetical protein
MASPDFSEYVDLTINDLQPIDIYEAARDYALVALPEFNPRVGTVEDAMLEAMSYVSGLTTGAINRLPNSLMEGLLRLMGFTRSEATFASGNVIMTAIDDTGLTIPEGTQVAYSETTADGVITHIFETTASVTIAEGETESGPVQIVALDAGEKPVLTDGTALTLLSPVSRLFEVTFDGSMSQGAESESDAEFFNRATTYLSSLSRSLATAEQVTNYILNTYPNAFRVKTYDLTRLQKFVADEVVFGVSEVGASFNIAQVSPTETYKTIDYTNEAASLTTTALSATPFGETETIFSYVRVMDTSEPDYDGIWELSSGIDSSNEPSSYLIEYDYGDGTSTDQILYPAQTPTVEFLDQVLVDADDVGGCITIFASSITGASLSSEDKAVIADDIRNKSIAGLNVYITDVILAPIEVAIDIKVVVGFSELDVRNAVDAEITTFLSPETFPFEQRLRANNLISKVAQISGVEYVDGITITSSNESIAYIAVNGDCVFRFKGTLPDASVTVAAV